jgi:carbon storage regulator
MLIKEEQNMLVLSRRVGEEIVIDGNIRIKVTGIHGERVRIGIIAPESMRVDRSEIHHRRNEFSAPGQFQEVWPTMP